MKGLPPTTGAKKLTVMTRRLYVSCSVETGVIPFCECSLKVSTRLQLFLTRDVLAKCNFCILLSSCLDTDVMMLWLLGSSRLLFGVNLRCLGILGISLDGPHGQSEVEGWDRHERSGRGTARDGGCNPVVPELSLKLYISNINRCMWVHYIYI